MAYLSVNTYSDALKRSVNFKLLLPNDLSAEFRENNPHYARPPKFLILLHGYSGSSQDWLLESDIAALAGKYNLAVALPSGQNSFYLDLPGTGRKYGCFIGEELPDYIRRTFGLEAAGEGAFVGGLSMGGFGALHVGLSYPERFSKIAAFSAALIIHQAAGMRPGFENDIADYDYYRFIFGDPEKLLQSEKNPEVLIRQLKEEGRTIPGIYLAIGTEDFLYEDNQQFRRFLSEEAIPFTYQEGPGGHDFAFWNRYLDDALRWFLNE